MPELHMVLTLAVDGQEWSPSYLTTLFCGTETFVRWVY
jgi:hypothetical protein